MLCLTGLIALALLIIGVHTAEPNGKSMVWLVLVLALSLGAGMVALARALMFKRKTQAELTGGEQYRALAEEYRRLADLAITAQEHTDLKLGDVSAQLDHLRDQTASLQKILEEVE
jgi:formate hydrogenlyase subunit 3/multisubunit Na+/H+ antiporter MnhD subunit